MGDNRIAGTFQRSIRTETHFSSATKLVASETATTIKADQTPQAKKRPLTQAGKPTSERMTQAPSATAKTRKIGNDDPKAKEAEAQRDRNARSRHRWEFGN